MAPAPLEAAGSETLAAQIAKPARPDAGSKARPAPGSRARPDARAGLARAGRRLAGLVPVRRCGRVQQVVGLLIAACGPSATIGELCYLLPGGDVPPVPAEVVGFREGLVLLMPLGLLAGVGPGCEVVAAGHETSVRLGPELMGRVLDGLGNPLDGRGPAGGAKTRSTRGRPPHPLSRPPVDTPVSVGIKAIDAVFTCGQGQRMGIFSGSGVGKSTLLAMIARNTAADVSVIALVGERGREVREFLDRDLGAAGLRRSVVVVATSDQPALVRIQAAYVATTIAEYFRDQGKNVMLLMDSVTRFAMALREVGLAVGEPPATRGYTPSVFAALPKLLERAGRTEAGSITGFYTVLIDGDDLTEPITDAMRGLLDGHVLLSRDLASRGHFPAIDVMGSISRLMPQVTSSEQQQAAIRVRALLAAHRDAEDLINIGAYVSGSNPEIDAAQRLLPAINSFLRQDVAERVGFGDALTGLRWLVSDAPPPAGPAATGAAPETDLAPGKAAG